MDPLPAVRTLVEKLGRRGFEVPVSNPSIGNFGDSPEMSDQLLALIREGKKKATASLAWEWEAEGQSLPVTGGLQIVLDWDQEPVMVLEFTDIQVQPFRAATAKHAWQEGEGDGSLDFWRAGHRAFFNRACAELGRQPSEDMPIVFARFRVLFDAG